MHWNDFHKLQNIIQEFILFLFPRKSFNFRAMNVVSHLLPTHAIGKSCYATVVVDKLCQKEAFRMGGYVSRNL